jgi:ABC-type transport system involved in cytochrome bd biosynthesis fused ATPase/permease subunit
MHKHRTSTSIYRIRGIRNGLPCLIVSCHAPAIHAMTMVTIAHHIDTIQHCDKIIILHVGRIVDTGSYQEMLSTTWFKSIFAS